MNCHHVLTDLERLEKEFEQELVIIGVHSGKFPTEKAEGGLKEAVLRYGITHPNVNDPEFKIFRRYEADAWPTLVTVNPEGMVVDYRSGEGRGELIRAEIRKAIEKSEKAGTLKRGKLEITAAESAVKPGVLMYPGKIAAGKDRLYIADTRHHRILEVEPSGKQVAAIGTGVRGFKDGSYAEAQFNLLQGLWVDGTTLYVADTENHKIRAVDLAARTVRTIAGNGVQSPARRNTAPPLEAALNSPWDVLPHDGQLYIAMAGSHQIWRMDLAGSKIDAWAGTGAENIRDGAIARSLFSQPSGLALREGVLYVADSEDSAIRSIDIAAGQVRTHVGTGLFDFGDVDGKGKKAKLQHPLAVSVIGEQLYFADSYNHRIKRLDLKTEDVVSVFGDGKPGLLDGVGTAAKFSEPSGMAVLGGKLYVADTNNHAIRVCDPATGKVETLSIAP